MNYYLLALFLAPPLLAVLNAYLEHPGKLDRCSGRKAAMEGLDN
jgi:hypothetical protein